MTSYISNSYQETEKFAFEFAKKVNPGDVIAMYGELGAGKTTFTKGLAKGLGIEDRISSPTFIIMRDYDLPTKDNSSLHHLDLYRLESESDMKSIDLNEIFNREKSISVVEWAEKANQDKLEKAIKISFKILDENKREINITFPGDK